MDRFTKDGRLIVPLNDKKSKTNRKKEEDIRYLVNEAYCPKGCSIMDKEHEINGSPGIRISFKRPKMKGEFVISAIEGDFTKTILSGELKNDVKDELYCPHCDTEFEKLVKCSCKHDGDLVLLGLTPKLDLNNAVAFCNVTGCDRGAFIKSGKILRHLRLGIPLKKKTI